MIVRYADDLAVLCRTRKEAQEAKRLLADWLKIRGLRLSENKTRICHITEGFNFLGFNVRQYPTPNSSRSGYKLLIKPSAESVNQIRKKLKGINPVIRGWSQYFRIGVAKQTFDDLDNFMYYRAKRYAKRRHPKKSGHWRVRKYWGQTKGRGDRWVFMDKISGAVLMKFSWVRIRRHALVPRDYSPDDPTLQDYWRQRRTKTSCATGYRYRRVFSHQSGICPVCHQHLENGEELHFHHVVPKKLGGTDDLDNLRLVHYYCHRQIHNNNAPLGVRQLLEP